MTLQSSTEDKVYRELSKIHMKKIISVNKTKALRT